MLAFVAERLDASWRSDYAGGLEVPSSNLGAPIEEKTCKSGNSLKVRRLMMLRFSPRKSPNAGGPSE
jgi:hypothetical protein